MFKILFVRKTELWRRIARSRFQFGFVLAALICLPSGVRAQFGYRAVPDWPAKAGQQAPDYGAGMVVGVAANAQGQVTVFQRTPHPVLVFDRQGRFLRSWGQHLFALPHGCRFDPQGNLWLTDVGHHQVYKYAPDGRLLQAWGVRDVPGNDASHFNQPADIAFAPNGDIYIADGYGNARVVQLDAQGKYKRAWGRRGTGPGQFRLVHSLAVDRQGRVYVVDRANRRVQVFTGEGRFLTQWRNIGHPFGLFLTPDQRLFVADGIADTISIYTLDGKRVARWGGTGSGPGKMRRAHLLCVDDQGAVVVAEVNGRRAQKYVPVSTPPISRREHKK